MSLLDEMTALAKRSKLASRELAALTTAEKNAALMAMADALDACVAPLVAANALDLEEGRRLGLTPSMLDRLRLDEKRIAAMANGLREVAALPDPVGRTLDDRLRPNGLRLQKLSTPIGVVVIIYESRPNVTADAASLCFKTGNATILRGGKEALNSNLLIASTMVAAGKAALPGRFPEDAIQVVPTTDREAIPALLSLTQYVDLCMPRGGEGLIRAVTNCSKVPVIKHYKGVCHVYVDAEADLDMAERLVLNAKVQRPSACNAMETLLVHREVADSFVPRIARRLGERKVELHCDAASTALIHAAGADSAAKIQPVSEKDWETEYNDYIANI
jgi:glutamate-5-semialdehyde dehydrogenase